MRERSDIVAIGLGNPLMTDEGAGPRVIHELVSRSERFNHVEFIEPCSSPMTVVHAIAGRRKAVLIDCAFMNEPAGTIRRFAPDEVVSRKATARFSLHEGDLLGALELSRSLGEYPDEVVIFGIQPESTVPGEGLSPELRGRFENYVEMVGAELA